MKRILSYIIVVLIGLSAVSVSPYASYALTQMPTVNADTAVLIDASSGKVLYDKNMHKQKFPASTTKVMTALLALERCNLADKVNIDTEVAYTEGSRVYLLEGEDITVEELLYCLMLESGNDAAIALGKHISGTTEQFTQLMNERAALAGAKNTHFANPNGLPDENHLTTAYDLAMIARELMEIEEARKIVTTYQKTIPATNMQDTRYLYNSNRLLWDANHTVEYNGALRPIKYDEVTGVKTGYTNAAGSCLVASAKRGDTEVISVVLQGEKLGYDFYLDSIKLLEYGLDNYETLTVSTAGTIINEIPVSSTQDKNLTVKGVQAEDVVYTAEKINAENQESVLGTFKTEIEMEEKIIAPVEKGQKIGVLKTFENNNLISEVDIIAQENVAASKWIEFGMWVKDPKNYYKQVLVVAGILIGLYLALIIVVKMINKRNRRIYLEKKARSEASKRNKARIDNIG